MSEVNNFLQYLVEKYFILHPIAELDEANTIDDIEIIKRSINTSMKKVTDENMILLCKDVFRFFKCYNITCEEDWGDCFTEVDASVIYMHYKKYKCSSNSTTRETEVSLRLDQTLQTSDTFYVTSLDKICTHDLKDVFGNYIHSGSPSDNYRYEYRLRFAKNGKVYKFSLYDYKDDNGNFYKESDIYWHVAANTNDKDIIKSFLVKLEQIVNESQSVVNCC